MDLRVGAMRSLPPNISGCADEAGLRRLAAQIKTGKVVVKLFLLHPLHEGPMILRLVQMMKVTPSDARPLEAYAISLPVPE
jgi:hypothetical protein